MRAARREKQRAAHQPDKRHQATLARTSARDQAIEQQLAGRRDQEALVWERARSKELEHQLAVRHGETEALAKERARSEILDQRLADKERAYSQDLDPQFPPRQAHQEPLPQTPPRI